jgi:hypothetical protein
LFGKLLIRRCQLADLFKAFEQELVNLLVSLGKFRGDFVQERSDPVFRHRHDSRDDSGDPIGIAGIEGPQKYARLIRLKDRSCAANVD